MFERSFAWTMRHGSRLLFAAFIVALLFGIAGLLATLREASEMMALGWQADWPILLGNIVYPYLTPPAFLLFAAVLTDRLRREDSGPR